MSGVLKGIRVIDLSRHISGPYCSSLLADMGAEVIRVERPGGDEDRRFGYLSPSGDSYAFVNRMRNKKAITLSLDHLEGKEIFEKLVKSSDIILENFAMRDKEKLGLNFESLRKIKPSVILASISAFGSSGPNTQRIGFDPIAQAISGVMSFNGFPGNPPTRTAAAWVDYAAAIHTAFGILLALRHRDNTGKGQAVEVALADVAAGLVALHGIYTEFEKLGMERPQMGNVSPYAYANSFQARDGWIFISLTRDGVWRRFLKAAGMEDIAQDPRFTSDWERSKNREALDEIITPWVRSKTLQEIISILQKAGVPCARINTIPQAFSEPQYREREILINAEHPVIGSLSTLGVIIKLSETPGHVTRGAPLVGQDNDQIYRNLGYTELELTRFKQIGII
jgi:crotonobetainyl-CoA:carnitine CoA-transferase CaiB-like acyl-CoA transferase